MIAARCPKCKNIGCTGVFCGYKTVHENAVNINPFSIEEQVKQQLEDFKKSILELNKYDNEYGYNVKSDKGTLILLSDVLALFSAKKDKKQ